MRIQRKNTNRLQISDAYLKIFLGRRGPYIEYLKGIFGYFRKNFMEMHSHSIPSRTRFGAINNAVYCNEKSL